MIPMRNSAIFHDMLVSVGGREISHYFSLQTSMRAKGWVNEIGELIVVCCICGAPEEEY